MSAAEVSTGSRRLLDVRWWVGAALLFGVLLRLGDATGGSRLWFLDPLLLGCFLAALARVERRPTGQPFRTTLMAASVFVGLAWGSGMLYELTLSSNGGTALGGLHPQTLPSFALAQGFYLPFAVLGFTLVRYTDVPLRTLFFASGAVSAFEMLSTGTLVTVLSSPFFVLAPLLVAYYMSVYAMFVCWPVAVFGTGRFRVAEPRHVSTWSAVAWMGAAGAASWLAFAALGTLLDRLAPAFMAR